MCTNKTAAKKYSKMPGCNIDSYTDIHGHGDRGEWNIPKNKQIL